MQTTIEFSAKKVRNYSSNYINVLLKVSSRSLHKLFRNNKVPLFVFDDTHEIFQGKTVIEMIFGLRCTTLSFNDALKHSTKRNGLLIVVAAKTGYESC